MLGLSLEHTRAHIARAVLEGVAHNLRWLLEVMGSHGMAPTRLRVIGGGVRSDLWMQIIADVTGLIVDTVDHPQYAGARGAALLAAVGTGALGSVSQVATLTGVSATFHPDRSVAAVHDRAHVAFVLCSPPPVVTPRPWRAVVAEVSLARGRRPTVRRSTIPAIGRLRIGRCRPPCRRSRGACSWPR